MPNSVFQHDRTRLLLSEQAASTVLPASVSQHQLLSECGPKDTSFEFFEENIVEAHVSASACEEASDTFKALDGHTLRDFWPLTPRSTGFTFARTNCTWQTRHPFFTGAPSLS